MLMGHYVVPFLVAIVAGAINSAAGGGTFLSFPTLLLLGFSPISANATNNTAMWVGNLGSIGGFREDFAVERSAIIAPVCVAIVGSIIGSVLLLHTPEVQFSRAVPYLLAFATIVFALSPLIRRSMNGVPMSPRAALVTALITTFFVSIYGGYFGAGIGIMLLALYSATTAMTIPRMNAFKNVVAFFVNGTAIIPFALANAIAWPTAIVMSLGAVTGAYFGARLIRRLPPLVARTVVIVIGASMTTYFFIRNA